MAADDYKLLSAKEKCDALRESWANVSQETIAELLNPKKIFHDVSAAIDYYERLESTLGGEIDGR